MWLILGIVLGGIGTLVLIIISALVGARLVHRRRGEYTESPPLTELFTTVDPEDNPDIVRGTGKLN